MKLGEVEFEGPFSQLTELDDAPGIYVVLCYNDDAGFKFMDMRKAKLVQTEVAKALAEKSWNASCEGKLRIAVCYSADETEIDIIKNQVLVAQFA